MLPFFVFLVFVFVPFLVVLLEGVVRPSQRNGRYLGYLRGLDLGERSVQFAGGGVQAGGGDPARIPSAGGSVLVGPLCDRPGAGLDVRESSRGDRERQIGRASCRERVCLYV